MAKKKAESISARAVRSAVERSVKALSNRSLRPEPPFGIQPGIIFGLILDNVGLDQAQTLADKIAANVSSATGRVGSAKLEPAVLAIKKRITVGFIDPSRLPIAFDQ